MRSYRGPESSCSAISLGYAKSSLRAAYLMMFDGAGLMIYMLALERPAANVAWRASGEAAPKFWAASLHCISWRAEHCRYAEVDTQRSARTVVRCRAVPTRVLW
jgi:hypothetical protein